MKKRPNIYIASDVSYDDIFSYLNETDPEGLGDLVYLILEKRKDIREEVESYLPRLAKRSHR